MKRRKGKKGSTFFPPCTNILVLVQCSLQRAPPCQNKDELGPVVKETSAMGSPWDLIRGLNIPHSEETLAPQPPQPPQPWHPWRPTRLSALFSSALAPQPTNSTKFSLSLSFSLYPSFIFSHSQQGETQWPATDPVWMWFWIISFSFLYVLILTL